MNELYKEIDRLKAENKRLEAETAAMRGLLVDLEGEQFNGICSCQPGINDHDIDIECDRCSVIRRIEAALSSSAIRRFSSSSRRSISLRAAGDTVYRVCPRSFW